eukprot:CAMPEP_0118990416 /NCGR_PEP_ID=MMETSP1173-20130426/49865_1 /TAXON_ID=1034831 /ORGANISM="Rhizochromulina marina cf, Strain CCMP1243" /LENGTH=41 /DNA_ID= /DNA_START= /DNA_END= /DNA_ORIENTATION=
MLDSVTPGGSVIPARKNPGSRILQASDAEDNLVFFLVLGLL